MKPGTREQGNEGPSERGRRGDVRDSSSICCEKNKKLRRKQKTQNRDCETVKLWTEVVDSKGSTVSQFHSFTHWHGGVGSGVWGGGSDLMGGWGLEYGGVGRKQWSVNSGQWSEKRRPRGPGNKGIEKQGTGNRGQRNREQRTENREQKTEDRGSWVVGRGPFWSRRGSSGRRFSARRSWNQYAPEGGNNRQTWKGRDQGNKGPREQGNERLTGAGPIYFGGGGLTSFGWAKLDGSESRRLCEGGALDRQDAKSIG